MKGIILASGAGSRTEILQKLLFHTATFWPVRTASFT
jgi:dTDP-glucose pyrophosphorylase